MISLPLVGISIGVLAVVVLVLKKGREAKLDQAVVLLLAGPGIATGCKIFFLGVKLTQTQLDSLQIDRTSLIIAGVATIWVLVQAVWQSLANPSPR